MKKNWNEIFTNLSDTEKDKIAILRVMECSNGVVQHAYRDEKPWALSLEATRTAMKFSMSCMKTLTIPLSKDQIITFEPETETLMREVRNLYISGFKKGNDDDLEEFMKVSAACIQALGEERILKAKEVLLQNLEDIPSEALEWGYKYIQQFFPCQKSA
jgi:hypothetical protein